MMNVDKFLTWFGLAFHTIRTARASSAVLLVLALFHAPVLYAENVVLNPVKDNSIYDGSILAGTLQNNTCGAGPDLFAGNNTRNPPKSRRALLEFDIAGSIPPGAVINSVTLTVMHNQTPDTQPTDPKLNRSDVSSTLCGGKSNHSGTNRT